jgi:hypothetical protein
LELLTHELFVIACVLSEIQLHPTALLAEAMPALAEEHASVMMATTSMGFFANLEMVHVTTVAGRIPMIEQTAEPIFLILEASASAQ